MAEGINGVAVGVLESPSSVVGDKDCLPGFEIGAIVELDGEAGGASHGASGVTSRRDVIGISAVAKYRVISSASSRRYVIGISSARSRRYVSGGISGRTTEIDGVDVGAIERLPVDIDRETVVADQRGEVITLVRGDGLIKFNGDGITGRFRPA